MAKNKPALRFKNDVPVKISFQSGEPQTGTGRFGPWHRYDVAVDGQEEVLFASKGLQDRLALMGDLSGRELEITKKGNGSKVSWEIREHGENVTPNVETEAKEFAKTQNQVAAAEIESLGKRVELLEERVNKASFVVKEMIERMRNMEAYIEEIQSSADQKAQEKARSRAIF